MKLIKDIIEKKLSNQKVLLGLKIRDLSLSEHISAYMHSLVYLGLDDENIVKKTKLWNKFFTSSGKSKLRYYKQIMKFKSSEEEVIMRAFNLIDEEKSKGGSGVGSLYRDDVFAILSYEHGIQE